MISTIHHATFGQLDLFFLEKARWEQANMEPCLTKSNCKNPSQKPSTSQMLEPQHYQMVFLNSVIVSPEKFYQATKTKG